MAIANIIDKLNQLTEENEKLKRTKDIALKRITDIKEGIENDFPIVLGSRQPLFDENIDKYIPISVIQNTINEEIKYHEKNISDIETITMFQNRTPREQAEIEFNKYAIVVLNQFLSKLLERKE